jgi:predicted HD phosphohydrolase
MTDASTAYDTSGITFTALDQTTADDLRRIARETIAFQPEVAEHILAMLRALAPVYVGFPVDQLTHNLQTAALAEQAGADTEMVVAALCHDIGKAVSIANHPRIAAEILRPYVREEVRWVIEVHQDFQGRFYFGHIGLDPDAREKHAGNEWYDAAARFTDEWDRRAFDPDFDTPPLEYFEERVREVFARPHMI